MSELCRLLGISNRRIGTLFIADPICKQVMESVSTILAARQPMASNQSIASIATVRLVAEIVVR